MLQKVGKSSPADGDDLPLKMCGKPHGFPWFPITMICKWWDFQIYVNLEEGDWMVGSRMLDYLNMMQHREQQRSVEWSFMYDSFMLYQILCPRQFDLGYKFTLK